MFKKLLFALLAIFLQNKISAQSHNQINNLIFEGAGIRGIAYCGALVELEAKGMDKNIHRVAGTSAGAIMAMMVSLGYSSEELKRTITNTNFKDFNDGKYFFAGGINRTSKYYGWYRSKAFDKWLGKLIESKTGDANITFRELHDQNFKDLFITGTCLNKQKLIIFSFETYPDMRVRDAVRISMSIPLYFEAVFLSPEGKIVHHPKNKEHLDIMVDGGFTGNFPIHIFDSTRYSAPGRANSFAANNHTIAFRIDKEEQIRNDSIGGELAEVEVRSLKNYLGAFYNIVIENLNRQTLNSHDWERTVSISDGGIGPRLRKLSADEIRILYENGKNAMKIYLQNNTDDAAIND